MKLVGFSLKYLSMSITNYLYVTISLSPMVMKKLLILLLIAMILFSGCVEKTVKSGDKISVDYVGRLENGKVFDTSIESVAKENNILITGKEYKLLNFTVGKGEIIPGFDEGVVGMKVGENKTLTIPPEKGYGPSNPELIRVYPIIQVVPKKFPRVFEIPLDEFEATFGKGHKIEDVVNIPRTSINLTIVNITTNVSLSYNFKVGEQVPSGAPWNETVVKIDEKNLTVNYSVKKNEVVQFRNVPWNTTVIDVNNDNITLRHNAIPDTVIPSMFGQTKVSFNETSIIMDQNHELAGKTLVFKVTLKSID